MPAPSAAPEPSPGPADPRDVLVVDDNPINAKLLRLALQARGHRVRVAAGAQEALGALGEARFDVALVDVQMPGMDGLALTRLLRRDPATANLPVVVVTARVGADDEARATAAGADAFVPKPVDTRALVTTVERLAGGASRAATWTAGPGVPPPSAGRPRA